MRKGTIQWYGMSVIVIVILVTAFPSHAQNSMACDELLSYRSQSERRFISVCDLQAKPFRLAAEYKEIGDLDSWGWQSNTAVLEDSDGWYLVDEETQVPRLWSKSHCPIGQTLSPDSRFYLNLEYEPDDRERLWVTAVDSDCTSYRISGPYGTANSGLETGTHMVWSPNGQYLALQVTRGASYEAKRDVDVVSTACLDDPGAECSQYTLYITDGSGTRYEYEQRAGKDRTIIKQEGWETPAWSPDSNRLAFSCWDYDICLLNRYGTDFQRLDVEHLSYEAMAWSPSGRYIAFESDPDRNYKDDIYLYDLVTNTIVQVTNTIDINEGGLMWLPMPEAAFLFEGGDE